MTLQQAWIGAAIILVGMAIMTAVAWPLMPAGAMIPIHFGFDGRPNRFAPATIGLLILPILAVVVSLFMSARAARNDLAGFVPLAERSAPPSWLFILAGFAGGQALIIGYALHASPDLLRFLFGAVGLLVIILGATMTGLEPNGAIGIRTPWTRADRGVWEATHRFGSVICVIVGISIVGMALFAATSASLILFTLVDVIAAAVICILYSYLASRSLVGRRAPPKRDRPAST